MSVFNTPAAPVGRAIAQCIIDGVERIGDEEIQFFFRTRIAHGSLATQSGVADEHGIGPDVFAELEKFVVSESVGTPVTPKVVLSGPLYGITYGLFPFNTVGERDALDDAVARPADKSRMQRFECLGNVTPQAVFPVAESLLWEKRNVIQQECTLSVEFDDKPCTAVRIRRGQRRVVAFPGLAGPCVDSVGTQFRSVFTDQPDSYVALESANVRSV